MMGFLSLSAQITYDANDYATTGDQFLVSAASPNILFNNYGQTGANFSWDYSNLSANAQETIQVEAPRSAGYYFSWISLCVLGGGSPLSCPGQFDDLTNLAIAADDTLDLGTVELTNETDHLFKSAQGLVRTLTGYRVGAGGTSLPLVSEYQLPDTLLYFPLTYQRRDSATFYQSQTFGSAGGGSGRVIAGDRIVEVDGWGSIETPFKTYADVIRVKSVVEARDSLFTGTDTIAIPNTQVIYQWYSKDEKWPVFEARGQVVLGQNIITQVSYLDTVQCFAPAASFLYQPFVPQLDTVGGEVEVTFQNFTQGGATYQWDFGDGNTSNLFSPIHRYTQSGTFTVQLVACNTTCMPSRCDTFQLPVFVQDAPVSVDQSLWETQGIQIGPNPTSEELTISRTGSSPITIQLMGTKGKIWFAQNWTSSQTTLNLSEFSAGVYVLQLSTEKGQLVRRRIIVR